MVSPEIENAVNKHALSCTAKTDIAEMKTDLALIKQSTACIPEIVSQLSRLEKDKTSFMGTWKGATTVIGIIFTVFSGILYFSADKWIETKITMANSNLETKIDDKIAKSISGLEDRTADATFEKILKYFNLNLSK